VSVLLLFTDRTRPAMLMFSHVQAFNENKEPQEHKNYTPWGFKILH